MIIKELNAAELEKFIHSDDFKNSEVIPISKHRAISHIKNPRLKYSDKIMFLAYSDKILVGYLGVIPEKIYNSREEINVGWLSCIWVDIKVRGKGIAQNLLQHALTCWEGKILATEYTTSAKALYDKSNAFVELTTLEGCRGYLRFNFHEILIGKSSFFRKIIPLLKLIDNSINVFNEIRLFFWRKKIHIDLNKVEYINEIDSETSTFISLKQKEELTRRNSDELNWIIKYPWILNAPDEDAFSRKYHFSSLDKSFENISLKVFDNNNQIIGFLMLVFRNNNLKIPYCYFEEKNSVEVLNVLFYHILKKKVNMVTVYNPSIVNYFKTRRTPFFHLRKMKRGYIITKTIFGSWGTSKIQTQDGDGDCAFT